MLGGARPDEPLTRAAMLGTAAGILFGLSAALTKTTVDQFEDGILTMLENWQLYALIVVGWVSMTMSQAALQTNALAPAVATQMALDPIASVLLGTLAFEETIHETPSTVIALPRGVRRDARRARLPRPAPGRSALVLLLSERGELLVRVGAGVGEEDRQADHEPDRRAGSRCRSAA